MSDKANLALKTAIESQQKEYFADKFFLNYAWTLALAKQTSTPESYNRYLRYAHYVEFTRPILEAFGVDLSENAFLAWQGEGDERDDIQSSITDEGLKD